MITVGLDYHTKWSHVSILDESGEEVTEKRLDSRCELKEFLEALPEAEALFEAGYGWPRLVKMLEGTDVNLHMCHPENNRRIADDRRKSDRRDARNLAVYLKTGSYKKAYMPDEATRDERQFVRMRINAGWRLTRIKNQIHSALAYAGVPKESVNIFAMKNRSYLETVEVLEHTRKALDLSVRQLDQDLEVMKELDGEIAAMNRQDPRARLLKTIPGVGDFTARVLLAEIGDIKRFPTAKSLACYAGLTPKQRQSGNSMRMMGITKEGSANIRWVLIQSAWIAIRIDPGLKRFYEKLEKEKCPAKAITAVAHKLVIAVWHILTKQVPYKPFESVDEGKPGVARGKSGATDSR
jgi:transposase